MARGKLVYRPSTDESVSQAVVTAVANANGVDPLELDERLYDCVDPDALDRLFASADHDDSSLRVTFRMAGCDVEIEATGTVVVREAPPAAAAPAKA